MMNLISVLQAFFIPSTSMVHVDTSSSGLDSETIGIPIDASSKR